MLSEVGPLTRAVIDLARAGQDERRLAAGICRACVECLDVDGAAISLLTATASRTTLSATDPTADSLEDLQFMLGEGVCIEAAISGRPVLVPDIRDHVLTTRWPVFAASVAEQSGARALFALPLQLGTINLGVLDLYRVSPGSLRGHELRDVVAAADTATLLLLAVPVTGDADGHLIGTRHVDRQANGDGMPPLFEGERPSWDGLWNDRAEVHQATGMILAQLGVPAQDAFIRLRAHAFAARRPLVDVARDVVARRLVFTPEMD